ncbi:P-loop containing nucleoside triphosphate hydrolase protein [Pleomassaria siparia CBS 279.74]|uniref:P-loop containing nucleoside triphosphate hydrolase protein n=1 Tax=Pleomassaria siparia CBS 279.74 TaxID=1314801 RepID=A0A6G1KNJ7_9PLEO|nr:P-loop containing nucleoside triphosphate hydrolase protein [Pleomassaria siparia CBS 279.74]
MVKKNSGAALKVEEHPGGGYIVVTAQQSRYALDAIDAPASKEPSKILIKDLTISVSTRQLLTHTTLHLVESRHYVLVGRNGTGKSTPLKAIGAGLIPGIPSSTRILLLGQTHDVEDEFEGLSIEDETVLQHVVQSDRMRRRYIREANTLTDAFEHLSDPIAPARAGRRIKNEILAVQLKEAHRTAERRSGARGKLARKELIKFEERCKESKAKLEQNEREIDPETMSNETRDAADMLADVLQASLEMMDASAAEAKARTVLLALGFEDEKIDRPFLELSGGWRTRCELASSLCQYAHVLLLDEPTNFLDLLSIIWLQDYIRNLKHTAVLITTHDRAFGDAVAEELIDKQKKHMEKSVENNIRGAREQGDDKKLKQAAPRKKKLDQRMGVQVGRNGGKFKLNPPRPLSALFGITGKGVVSLSGPKECPLTLKDIDLTIHPATRMGIVGLNGFGKTTLVSLIMGSGDDVVGGLSPTMGIVTRHSRAKFGHFSQQSVEELNAIAIQKPKLTAMSHVMEVCGGAMLEKDARQLLGAVRALAKLLWPPPQLLILDEVTTHLDAETILGLVMALGDYVRWGAAGRDSRRILYEVGWVELLRATTVVEGESPYKLAPGVQGDDPAEETSDDEVTGPAAGTVHVLTLAGPIEETGRWHERLRVTSWIPGLRTPYMLAVSVSVPAAVVVVVSVSVTVS